MKSIIVKKSNKKDLVSYIMHIFPSVSYSTIQKALRNKDIKLNNIRINKNININEADKIDIYINDTILFNLPQKIDIIFEDDNILVCYKPQGILSNNEYSKDNFNFEPTFDDLVKEIYPNVKLCHRLDRNTAGLLIFAKNNKSYNELLNGFKNHYIKKEYIAYVANCNFDKNYEILEKYILKNEKYGYSEIYDYNKKGSQKIVTEYFVTKKDTIQDYAILRVIIHTGKTHQIRAQMKNISHPIIGDSKYGKNEINKKFKINKQLLFAFKYTFNFNDSSYLKYLNNIAVTLDKKYYSNKIGSDFYGKNT